MGVRSGAGGESALLLPRSMGRRHTAVGMSNAHIVGSHVLSEVGSRDIRFSRCARNGTALDCNWHPHRPCIHRKSMLITVQWSSGYDFCLTHRRSPVRSRVEPVFSFLACRMRANENKLGTFFDVSLM
jgi:hypothetical protein